MSQPVTPRPDRPDGAEDDVHFSEELVEYFVTRYTEAGQLVLDPFAGLGTTLAVAARLHRRSIGVEILPGSATYIRTHQPDANVIEGDARQLRDLITAPIDLVLTSPPYMTSIDHPQNPLTGYQTLDGDYETYLRELTDVFAQAAAALAPTGRIVVNAANIRHGSHVTTLAWDIAQRLSTQLQFEDEVVLCWPHPTPHFTNDYCLVFSSRNV